MNYIIEGDIDFWNELNDDSDDKDKIEKCLLTNSPLSRNYITLPCDHKFNYKPLYNEIIHSKNYQKYNKFPLKSYQIRCPYCRTKHNKLLPWIPIEGVEFNRLACSKVKGSTITHKECQYCYKSGKSKGKKCGDLKAYEGEDGLILCPKHRKQHEKNKSKKQETQSKKKVTNKQLTKEEEKFMKSLLKRQMQSYLELNNKDYKKSATKLVLLRTMQLHNLALDIDIVKKSNSNNIIISTTV